MRVRKEYAVCDIHVGMVGLKFEFPRKMANGYLLSVGDHIVCTPSEDGKYIPGVVRVTKTAKQERKKILSDLEKWDPAGPARIAKYLSKPRGKNRVIRRK